MAGPLTDRLSRASAVVFTMVAGLAGFCAYFSMYAFRKPFTAATFDSVAGWPFALDYKIALVIAQVLGYALSKLIGIRVIAEIAPARRGAALVGLILTGGLTLVGFALTPAPWNIGWMFLNGLPLGLIWGLVFGYMEGRRTSEVLGAILCASFILSSGVVKSVGKWLMSAAHIGPFWMPAAAAAVFLPLLLASTWVLEQLPPPSAQDEAERVRREPMTRRQRAEFIKAYAPGLTLLVLAYVLLTAFRDFRDNFAAEIWRALGYGEAANVFSASELPVAVVALLAMASIIVVRDNRRAVLFIHGVVIAGAVLLGASTLAFQAGLLSPLAWMIAAGAGLYMAYTPFNAILFDRLIAQSGRLANAGFLIYVADAAGYLGSVALLLWRNLGAARLDWLRFFVRGACWVSLAVAALTLAAAVYFLRRPAAKAADLGQATETADTRAGRPVRALKNR